MQKAAGATLHWQCEPVGLRPRLRAPIADVALARNRAPSIEGEFSANWSLIMKRLLCAVASIASAATFPAVAATIGLSVQVGEPGFFGRIDIGDAPPPQLIYPQPVVIHAPPVELEREPIYLHVPPEQARNWWKYCRQYNACGERVYFVQDNWYRNEYVPHYREHYARAHEEERHEEMRHEEMRHEEHEHGKEHREN
ncbi:MAG TPA: hypothetical protein VHB46_01545 [Burkholderiales bacterium]|nr:hypothetical protein [Burkholderiales bacterium]